MNTPLTVTIGIPAYNEAANIAKLLQSLCNQVLSSGILEHITIIADGCTDNTIAEIKSITDGRIKLIEHTNRQGLIASQNEIASVTNSDILILLDADILPRSSLFTETLIQPILADKDVGMTGADTTSAEPITFIERVLAESHNFKTHVYRRLNRGNNLYLCHGRARAFSHQLYKQLIWPVHYAEDSYSYLFCKQKNYKFVYVPTAQVIFRSPQNLSDYLKQSLRFMHGKKQLIKSFPSGFAHKEFYIPKILLIRSAIRSFLKHPILISIYALITAWRRIIYIFHSQHNHSLYAPSLSSKKI